MPRPKLKVLVFSGLVLAGCGKSANNTGSGRHDPVRLSQDDYDFLMAMNTSQADLKDGIQIAFNKSALAPEASQKAIAISKVLAADCAVDTWSTPAWTYASDWSATQALKNGVADCPLNYSRDWQYVKATSSLAAHSSFHYASDALRDLGAVTDRNSSFSVSSRAVKGGLLISGEGDTTFKVTGVGEVRMHLSIAHQLVNTRTTSTVSAHLWIGGRFNHVVRVEENSISGPRSYLVDARSLDQKEFQSLFSALELDEIMDNTKVLR